MASTSEKSSSVGMPQLDFSNFDNQAFWLLVFILLVFLVIRLLVMPRMEETLTNRRKIIEEDIQEAEEFRDKAVEIEKIKTRYLIKKMNLKILENLLLINLKNLFIIFFIFTTSI